MARLSPAWESEMTRRTPPEAAVAQAPEELGPEQLVLGVAHFQVEHLSVAVLGHSGGHHHRSGDDAMIYPGLQVGGVQEHVRTQGGRGAGTGRPLLPHRSRISSPSAGGGRPDPGSELGINELLEGSLQ